jgi:hypothetical protein
MTKQKLRCDKCGKLHDADTMVTQDYYSPTGQHKQLNICEPCEKIAHQPYHEIMDEHIYNVDDCGQW